MPNDDLRADLNAAFDAAEAAPDTAPSTPTPEVAPEGASQPPAPSEAAQPSPPELGETAQEARARDEKGRFAPKGPEAPAPAIGAPVKPQAPAEVAPTPPVESVKAPQSWKPAIREKFAALPPEVQQEVIRREREVEQTQRESAQYRQEATRFRETMAPFEHMIRAEGADPYRTVGSLMQTAMALQSGAPGTKAGIVANLIRHYGVDINQLASVLDGQPIPQQEQQPYRDPRVDQLLSQVEQAKSQRQQALMGEAQRLIGEIQGEEFFGDVKDAMADILEIAAKRGVAMTPRDAYNRAVWADPHVAEVLQRRREAKQAGNPNGSTQRAVAAASSIRGSPAAPAVSAQPGTLRGDIEAAAERLQSR